MKIQQCRWNAQTRWSTLRGDMRGDDAQLVLVFGACDLLAQAVHFESLRKTYPNATIITCSTAGEIIGTHVLDDSLVSTAIRFDHGEFNAACVHIDDASQSFAAGQELAGTIHRPGLSHVLVLSDGLKVNGSELVKGLSAHLPADVAITGGLSGDSMRFRQTLVGCDAPPTDGNIVAIGFYGKRIKIGFGTMGGWDNFGPDRIVTRSQGNMLYEVDGQSALGLYKKYLGEYAKGLPGTGLLFPMSIRPTLDDRGVVRTILAVDEAKQSMTFAGDIPQGWIARLMRANFDRMVDGSQQAAKSSRITLGADQPDLAILVSCVGRKLVLKQRVEEEVEAVRHVLGDGAALSGFYSYGEISPFQRSTRCELHNQSMSITSFSEN